MSSAEPAGMSVSMTYTALGQRVQKDANGTVTNFLYDLKNLLHETDENDGPTKNYTTTDDEYGDLVSQFDETTDGGPTEFYHQFDAQHSTNALTDDAGSVTQTFKYQAFGLPKNTKNKFL